MQSNRRSPQRPLAFTLVELLTVMAVIAILAGLILSISGMVQKNSSSMRADTEVKALSVACEAFKSDNGTYPHQPLSSTGSGNTTGSNGVINWSGAQLPYPSDILDPRSNGNSQFNNSAYAQASLELYEALSGDVNRVGQGGGPGVHNYIQDIRPDSLGVYYSGSSVSISNPVTCLQDPFGNCYGYSTANNTYVATGTNFATSGAGASNTTGPGFNPSFDLWSTGGQIANPYSSTGGGTQAAGAPGDPMLQWKKNW